MDRLPRNGMNDPALDALLRTRAAPVPPDHLEAHIVAMAARTPQDGAVGSEAVRLRRSRWSGWQAELMQLLAVPKPAYAFGIVLMAGLALGVGLGVSPVDTTAGDWTNLFASGESWL